MNVYSELFKKWIPTNLIELIRTNIKKTTFINYMLNCFNRLKIDFIHFILLDFCFINSKKKI